MGCLLDTSVAIHLRDGDAPVIAHFEALAERPFLSAITRVELEGGVYADTAYREKRRLAVDALLSMLPLLDFDFEMSAVYGSILEQRGFNKRKVIDRMIAATALVNDLTLITMNGRDFADVPGLKLEVWTV